MRGLAMKAESEDSQRSASLIAGEGLVKVNSRVDDEGVEHGRLGVTARLTTADGERVHLNAHGEIGTLTDFVNYGG